MRGKSLVSLFGLVLCLCIISTLAQGEEEKPRLYFVQEFAVKPNKVTDFETLMKEAASIYAKHNLPYSYYVIGMNNYQYAALFPVNNYGVVDEMYMAVFEVFSKVGEEKIQEMHNRHGDTIEHQKSYFIRYSPELSYTSENPRFKPEEANFRYMPLCYVKPGKESEFEEICKEWVSLDKSVNRADSYDMFVGDIGTEMPFYFWVARAKSAADFYKQQEVYGSKGGEKILDLWKRTMALCRKYDEKSGMYRLDLSYTPKEK
jgi:hypothetical protein